MNRKNIYYSRLANRVLAAAFILFALSVAIRHITGTSFWTELFFHVTQAALIGGIADWFAVTALFTKPLGIPWHTALIPRNRDKLIESIAVTVEQDFLSPSLIRERLAGLRLTPYLIAWVDSEAGRQRIEQFAADYIQRFISSIDKSALTERLTVVLREQAAVSRFDSQLQSAGRWVLANRHDEQVITAVLDELLRVAVNRQTGEIIGSYIRNLRHQAAKQPLAQFALWLGEQTDSLNIDDMVQALQQDLAALLTALKSPSHPVRRWSRKQMFDFVRRIKADEKLAGSLTEWQRQVAGRLPLEGILAQLLETVLEPRRWRGQKGLYHAPVLVWGFAQIRLHWQMFKQDDGLQTWLDERLRQAVGVLVETEHSFIGTVVRESLATFSDGDINQFVAEKVGEDLAWIRINGSVVGAVVGLILFLFLRFVYDPFFTPIIRQWLE